MTTNCAFPPELDDKQLLSYLDGNADEATIYHLKGCAYCREKAQALDRLQKHLTRRLYRLTCPSPIELGEYHLRMLPPSQMLLIAQHVRECPHCTREIAELEGFFLGDLAPMEGSLLGKAKVLIARLVRGKEGRQSGEFSPAFTGVRGEGEEPLIYQAGTYKIRIDVYADVEHMGRKELLGLVTGLESNELSVQLSQEDQIIATASLDAIGNFSIPHLLPGHYQLILNGPNVEIHIQSLQVI